MASGLPVIGLDAEGTRDLVTNNKMGYLLPQPPCDWSTACQRSSPHFRQLAAQYAQLLTKACVSHGDREEMGRKASTEGIKGYTWWDAMEVCSLVPASPT
jgi:glycosyltransferase involved in cell wall biosynthesis